MGRWLLEAGFLLSHQVRLEVVQCSRKCFQTKGVQLAVKVGQNVVAGLCSI